MSGIGTSFKESIRVLGLLKHRKWPYIIGAVGDSAAHASLPIIAAFVYIKSFDAAISQNTQMIINSSIVFCISIVAVSLFSAICKYLGVYMAKSSIRDLRESVYEKVLSLPIASHEQIHSGDYVTRMTVDVQAIEDLYLNQFKSFFYFFSYSTGSIITMLILDWKIALVLIAITFVSSYLVTRFASSLRGLNNNLQKTKAELSEQTIDVLSGLRVIKMYQAESYILNRSLNVNDKLTNSKKKIGFKSAIMDAISYFMHIINYYGVILLGVLMVFTGQIGVGIVIAFAQLQFNMSNAFLQLGQFMVQLQGGLAGASRVTELLNMKTEREIVTNKLELKELLLQVKLMDGKSIIEFCHTDFSYSLGKPILKGMEFVIKKGQVVAFVGESGSGKSTIAKLLLGFYQHQNGDILLNNKSIREYGVKDLRDLIAYIPQDAHLFDGTIYDNIRYGNPEASEKEVYEAAKAAIAHDFITSFPEGYNTQVGERGSRMSGGQKQRIAIARAFLKDAPIVILDEATSALDSESERWVQKSLQKLIKNRTVIVIAHKVSAIENADLIFVVQDGMIVERGTHTALMENRGTYYELYKDQVSSQSYEVAQKGDEREPILL